MHALARCMRGMDALDRRAGVVELAAIAERMRAPLAPRASPTASAAEITIQPGCSIEPTCTSSASMLPEKVVLTKVARAGSVRSVENRIVDWPLPPSSAASFTAQPLHGMRWPSEATRR